MKKDSEKIILITGAAGFIGYHLCKYLLEKEFTIIGLDNINDYYDIELKYSRLHQLGIIKKKAQRFNEICLSTKYGNKLQFIRLNLEEKENIKTLFKKNNIDIVCNLAAQAGVRYSLINPDKYISSNIIGFFNILECCKQYNIKKLVYASSSSVYGNNQNIPFIEEEKVDQPVSLYAATKTSNELLAYSYSSLFSIQTIGLRFFTVYGPWGRPDMALFLFTDAILKKKAIKVFNNGNLLRDFTYIDDIIDGVSKVLLNKKNELKYSIYNIGNSKPVSLLDFIDEIEKQLNIKSIRKYMPMQAGDVKKTYASTKKINEDYNYVPKTSIRSGIKDFLKWYKSYYKI